LDALPWKSTHVRESLVAIAVSHRFVPIKKSRMLRSQLLTLCRAEKTRICRIAKVSIYNRIGLGGQSVPSSSVANVAEAYWSSTFCLQPIGDGVTRKGTVDAIALGCIPVIFREHERLQWPWFWGTWVHDATVLVDYQNASDIINILRSIPAANVSRMKATIAAYGHQMQYNAEELPGMAEDAFEISIQKAWRLSQSEERRLSGAAMQALSRGPRRSKAELSCSLRNALMKRKGVPNSTGDRDANFRSHLLPL
jgi:hypothetical protein